MIRTYRAELARLCRPRVLARTALATTVLFVLIATLVVANDRSFSHAGGGTEVFRTAVAFMGTFLFVAFAGAMAAEFSRGTIRTMLLRQPGRLTLLAGKLAALLTLAAATVAYAEAVTWLVARVQADEGAQWTGMDALTAAVGDYGAVLVWITGYAVLATALAVVLRSVPMTLAVGIAWAGPLEHIIQNAWAPAGRLFPGLLLEAFAAGGTEQIGAGEALGRFALYGAAAAVIATTVFSRRDITN